MPAAQETDGPIEVRVLGRINIATPSVRTVLTIAAPFEMSRANPELVGRIIKEQLGGGEWRVTGLDAHQPAFPIRAGEIVAVSVVPLSA